MTDMPRKHSPAYNELVSRSLGDAEPDIVPYWRERAAQLQRELDVAKGNIHDFLTWPTVVSCMFVGTNSQTNLMLGWLNDKWLDAARETWTGRPQPHELASWTSGQMIYNAYHLQLLEERTGIDISELSSIREFGGGYGSMASLAMRAGFTGMYEIVDLPVVSELQRFYLWNNEHDDDSYRLIELSQAEPYSADLVIGLCSLSEASLPTRNRYMELVEGSRAYLLRYGPRYEGVDNVTYFEDMFPDGDVILHPLTGGPPGHRILIHER